MKRSIARIVAALALVAAAYFPVGAVEADCPKPASYPRRPVQVILHNAAGDITDIMFRALISEVDLGRPITIVNRGGASGTIGTTEAANAAPDGYTLTIGAAAPFYIRPHIDQLNYDISDFRHIVRISPEEPLVLIVAETSPYKTFQDLEAAWRRGEGLKLSSANPGSLGHCATMDILKQKGLSGAVNIPAMGGTVALTDMLGGHTDFMPSDLADVIPRVANGQVRALAVFGDERVDVLPDVPCMKELGLEGTSYAVAFKWIAVPKDVPEEIIDYLKCQFNKGVVKEKYSKFIKDLNGQDTYAESEEELTRKVQACYVKLGEIVEMIGLKNQ
ncbi:MAG: tripartite tricarboxylate transporter substrate binding protein [Planctomycetaceae bacterium]|nr:tripartite tricarboxylate transporter substrate binding protein [Planctomycetaceae bacterium]